MTAILGLLATVGIYALAVQLYKRVKHPLLTPIAITVIALIGGLLLFGIPVSSYRPGAELLLAVLPLTITVLAIPLYKQLSLLKKYKVPVLAGIVAGVATSAVSVVGLSLLFGLDGEVVKSLLPKSITTPLGLELTTMLGGVQSLTVIAIVLTGILGVLLYPVAFWLFRITHPIARGLAMGTASHAVGTSKALELGEEEGAMSSLAIIITGLITLLSTPLLLLLMTIYPN